MAPKPNDAVIKDEEEEVQGDRSPRNASRSSSSSSRSSSISHQCEEEEEEQEEVTGDHRPPPPPFPARILGQPVYLRYDTARKKYNIVVYCSRHPDCERWRTTDMLVERFGPHAAEHYLACWLLGCDKSRDEHKAWRPNHRDIQNYIDTYIAPDE